MTPKSIPPQTDDYSAENAEDPDSLSFTLTNDHGITLDAHLDDGRWLHLLSPSFKTTIMDTIGMAMAHEGHDQADIAVLFSDADKLAELNETHRQKTGPTDVLSFPAGDDDLAADDGWEDQFLGDIAIAYDVMENQAKEMGIPLSDHCLHLILHAVLHLLGHDHIDGDDAAKMEGLEIQILGQFGIANPYDHLDGIEGSDLKGEGS